jgi:hypothetical protein
MKKYRKKLIVIEAEQWFKVEVISFGLTDKIAPSYHLGVGYYGHPEVDPTRKCCTCGDVMHNHGWIDTPSEGDWIIEREGHVVCPGDWIIKGINGEFYPCNPDVFEKTYEPILEIKPEYIDYEPILEIKPEYIDYGPILEKMWRDIDEDQPYTGESSMNKRKCDDCKWCVDADSSLEKDMRNSIYTNIYYVAECHYHAANNYEYIDDGQYIICNPFPLVDRDSHICSHFSLKPELEENNAE